jgi:hypothetical protein
MQPLLVPERVELAADEVAIVEESFDLFGWGFAGGHVRTLAGLIWDRHGSAWIWIWDRHGTWDRHESGTGMEHGTGMDG